MEKIGIYYLIMLVLTIILALISCRLDYCNSLLYNVPTHKTDRLQRLQNQCARILTKSPLREHITPVLKSLHWLKIQDRITYTILMLTYKSYYNIAPTYLCELISRRESSVNTRLGSDQHQLIIIIIIITYSSIALLSSSARTCSMRCIILHVFKFMQIIIYKNVCILYKKNKKK